MEDSHINHSGYDFDAILPEAAGGFLFTAFDPYTANLDRAHGQDRSHAPTRTGPLPLEAHSELLALRDRRMDRPDHPRGDNDIVGRYKSPNRVPEFGA
jgi:hypothetical protein